MPEARVKYRPLHPKQREIYAGLGPRNVLRCGRRFGKTELLETVFSKRAIRGRKIGFFSPDYKIARPTYTRLLRLFGDGLVSHASKTESIIELKTGGSIEFWTLDNEDAGRSRDYDDAVIDEASLVKKGLREIVEQAIMPTLLDRRGTLTMAGTPKGIDPENFFYLACTDPKLKCSPLNEVGFREFYAPTRDNPTLDPVGVAALQDEYPDLVYRQEYEALFVDWSGEAFFTPASLLDEGVGVEYPVICDTVFAVIDTATKTGKENDGTAVLYVAYTKVPLRSWQLTILDWDVHQIEGALLETWLPQVFRNCQELATVCKARYGSIGVWIEDKSSGMVLLQQATRRGWPCRAIDSKLTSVGKSERAISVSGYVHQGKVKVSRTAHDKVTNYKGSTRNHLMSQVTGFRIGLKDGAEDDLLDCFTYATAIALGNNEGF